MYPECAVQHSGFVGSHIDRYAKFETRFGGFLAQEPVSLAF